MLSKRFSCEEEGGVPMKLFTKFLSMIVPGLLFWFPVGLNAETLPEAVHYMLQTNPEIRAISFNRQARDEEVKQAQADYWPILDVSYGAGYSDIDNYLDNESSNPQSTVVSLRQNLFRGFGTQYEVKRQESRVASQAYLLQGASENIALRTSRVYLNVLRQQELLDLSKENVQTHQRIYDQMKLRSESGIDRKADLDQVMGRLNLAESDVIVSQANVADAMTDYHFTVGRMPENLVEPHPVDSVMPATIDETEQMALANYPVLKSAQADVQAREAQHVVAKSNYYPKLDIAVDQKWEDEVDVPEYKEELTAMAMIRLNIFNGWRDKARVAETQKLICEAREIRNNTYRQIVESVRLSWVAYQSSLSRISYLENYVESMSTTAEAFTKQWNIGRRTMFDVLDIEAELINAKIDLVNAKYDKIYAQYRVLSGMGRLVYTLGLQWPVESQIEDDIKVQTMDIKAGPEPVSNLSPLYDEWFSNASGAINWDMSTVSER
jgi:adhesin transport system outer membrane protein